MNEEQKRKEERKSDTERKRLEELIWPKMKARNSVETLEKEHQNAVRPYQNKKGQKKENSMWHRNPIGVIQLLKMRQWIIVRKIYHRKMFIVILGLTNK